MKTSNVCKRLSAIIMAFVMVLGLFGVLGNSIKADAAAEKVKMYYCDSRYYRNLVTLSDIYIQINDSAQNKAVVVHYQDQNSDGFVWLDENASYLATLSDGSQIWKAAIGSHATEYAIKYVGNGQTYWDNNNGNNYTTEDVLGTGPIMVNRLHPQWNTSDSYPFKVEVTLKNLAYNKVVKVRYTQDNWATYQDVPLSYVSSNTSKGTEIWDTYITLDLNKQANFQYCVYYEVNGQTYWDSNFGANYDSNYHIVYH